MAAGATGLLAAALLLACADADDVARGPWLQQVLVADNRPLAERDPAQTAEKYRKMASSPYAFFRATLSVFLGDARRPGPGFWPTAFGSGPATRVLALGDPHLENFGSFENGLGVHTLEINDFDGATFGPYHLDVRRLALGVHVGADQIGLSAADRDAAVQAALDGYVAELQSESAGAPPVAVTPQAGFGAVVDDLLRRAARDGEAREELDEYTRVVDGTRVPWYGVLEDPVGGYTRDELVPLTAA
ncbi:MAG: DUF2252 family protein, partial [Myxococcales bacterium]|nr:DUF2252 family protein [Myxococcales bacterium]